MGIRRAITKTRSHDRGTYYIARNRRGKVIARSDTLEEVHARLDEIDAGLEDAETILEDFDIDEEVEEEVEEEVFDYEDDDEG